MFRVSFLLATAALVLLCVGWQGNLFDTFHGRDVVAKPAGYWFLSSPAVTVLSKPTELTLHVGGSVLVQADALAAPGDKVILYTAGAYGLGSVQVSAGVLDQYRQATLPVPGRDYLGSFNYWATVPANGSYQAGSSPTFAINITAAQAPKSPVCGDASALQKADGSPWVCSFDDEFNGTALDRAFWVPQVTANSGVTSGTNSMYACSEDSPETIAVQGGNLELSLVAHPSVQQCGKNKASAYGYGQVMNFQTFSQTYGKYEIRAKIPDLPMPGVQESFWLWPVTDSYGSWPSSGEIDIAEMYSSVPGVDQPYLHYLPGATSTANQNRTHGACNINPGAYNTYGVEWKPKQITLLLNGNVCFIDDYSSIAAAWQGANSPFDKPFFLSLDQAMGTTGNEYNPSIMPSRVTTDVDYVRVWK